MRSTTRKLRKRAWPPFPFQFLFTFLRPGANLLHGDGPREQFDQEGSGEVCRAREYHAGQTRRDAGRRLEAGAVRRARPEGEGRRRRDADAGNAGQGEQGGRNGDAASLFARSFRGELRYELYSVVRIRYAGGAKRHAETTFNDGRGKKPMIQDQHQPYDRSSKWLIQHHGDSMLWLARVKNIRAWRPAQAELVQPRRLPGGVAGSPAGGRNRGSTVLAGSDVVTQVFSFLRYNDLGLLTILGGKEVMLEIPFLDEIVMEKTRETARRTA
jgi:hypothetical protein